MLSTVEERRRQIDRIEERARVCERCVLSETRINVVFGAGDRNADLMFVGEAPGAAEDREGQPFIGRSGQLLSRCLADVGITRDEVFITSMLKCRPPGNRDPSTAEIESCRPWIEEQIDLIEPRVVATLGNFATRALSGNRTGITKIHGQPRPRRLGDRTVWFLPLFHPAAALRSSGVAAKFAADLETLPELLARELPADEETVSS